jgi:hypothetical protein
MTCHFNLSGPRRGCMPGVGKIDDIAKQEIVNFVAKGIPLLMKQRYGLFRKFTYEQQ